MAVARSVHEVRRSTYNYAKGVKQIGVRVLSMVNAVPPIARDGLYSSIQEFTVGKSGR